MNKITQTLIAGLGSFALFASATSAATHTFQITLTAQPGGTGSGSGTATFDDATGMFNWNYNFTGLSGTVQDAHFHGVDGFEIPIPNPETSPNSGGASLTYEHQILALLNGSFYLNIHTSVVPGGELKGFLVSNAIKLAEIEALKKKIDDLEKKYKKTKSKISKAKAKKLKKSIKKLLDQLKALNASL